MIGVLAIVFVSIAIVLLISMAFLLYEMDIHNPGRPQVPMCRCGRCLQGCPCHQCKESE